MKRLLTIFPFLLLCLFTETKSQEVGINIHYTFIHAKEWNRATEVYNFSRPFLPNKQPTLAHGIGLGLYYLHDPNQTLAWGPSISFSLHRSTANNPHFNIRNRAIILELGTKIQYRPQLERENPFRFSVTPSITTALLSRKLNGKVVIVGETEEDQKLRKRGIGMGLNAQVHYDLSLDEPWILSPFIGVNFHPFLFVSRSDMIFNEAATTDLKSTTSLWNWQAGITLRKQ